MGTSEAELKVIRRAGPPSDDMTYTSEMQDTIDIQKEELEAKQETIDTQKEELETARRQLQEMAEKLRQLEKAEK